MSSHPLSWWHRHYAYSLSDEAVGELADATFVATATILTDDKLHKALPSADRAPGDPATAIRIAFLVERAAPASGFDIALSWHLVTLANGDPYRPRSWYPTYAISRALFLFIQDRIGFREPISRAEHRRALALLKRYSRHLPAARAFARFHNAAE